MNTLAYDRIEAKRLALDLSAKELCRRAGLNESTLANAKRNGGALALETIEKFAATLGCTAAELRGLDTTPAVTTTLPGFERIDLPLLTPSPLNPRKTFDETALRELADSIERNGLLQNLTVRPTGAADALGRPDYWIVAGERRYRALRLLAQENRLPESLAAGIPCNVRELTDAEHLAVSLLENLQRRDVNPMEEANAFARLTALGWTTAQIAEKIGTTQRHIQQRLALTQRLAPECQEALQAGKINFTQARALLAAKPKEQATLLKNIKNFPTVEAIRAKVMREMIPFSLAIFPRETYLGEIVEADDGKEYATDKEAFVAAQRAAAVQLAEQKRAKGRSGFPGLEFVEVVERYFSFPVWEYPEHQGDAPKGIIIWINTDTYEVKTLTDRMRRPQQDETAAEAAARAEREAKETAQNAEFEAFTLALRAKVAARYDAATALLLASFDRCMNYQAKEFPAVDLRGSGALAPTPNDWRATLTALMTVPTHDVAKIIANHLDCNRWHFPPALIAAADLLGVAVPAWLRPQPEANAVRPAEPDTLPLEDEAEPEADDEGEFAHALDDLVDGEGEGDDPINGVAPWSRPLSTTCPDDAA
ncbi:MAG: ParB/RepB/Spo0J family partition protein [Rhodospirillaceae bacterium]